MVHLPFVESLQVLLQSWQLLRHLLPDHLRGPLSLRILLTIQVLLQMSLMLRPENSSVSFANRVSSFSLRCFAYLLKISTRDCRSGREKVTERSILLSMAGSRSILRLVAQISSTFVLDSKLSIFRSKVDRILRLA